MASAFLSAAEPATEESPLLRSSGSFQDTADVKIPLCRRVWRIVRSVYLATKILLLLIFLCFLPDRPEDWRTVIVKNSQPVDVDLGSYSGQERVTAEVWGPLLPDPLRNFTDLRLTLQLGQQRWEIPLARPSLLGDQLLLPRQHQFLLTSDQLLVGTNSPEVVPLDIRLVPAPGQSVAFACLLLLALHLVMAFKVFRRTVTLLMVALMSLGVLAYLGQRPSVQQVSSWLDWNELGLLFGLLILMEILWQEPGILDRVADLAIRCCGAKDWYILVVLGGLSAVFSALVGPSAMVLLGTPVVLRLAERMEFEAGRFLPILLVFSNLGGAATPLGSRQLSVLLSRPSILQTEVGWVDYTLHALPAALICCLGVLALFWALWDPGPLNSSGLKEEIAAWCRARDSQVFYTGSERTVRTALTHKTNSLTNLLRKKLFDVRSAETSTWQCSTCEEVRPRPPLSLILSISGALLLIAVQRSIPVLQPYQGYAALMSSLGVMLACSERLPSGDTTLSRLEWQVLGQLAAMTVIRKAVDRLGLGDALVASLDSTLSSVDPDYRLTASIMAVLWTSAFLAAVTGTAAPLTALIPRLGGLSLVLAICLGTCVGGCATSVGSDANILGVGVAELHGVRARGFYRLGVSAAVLSTLLVSAFLLVSHVLGSWS